LDHNHFLKEFGENILDHNHFLKDLSENQYESSEVLASHPCKGALLLEKLQMSE
jgi:hypothetical protein